MTEGSDFITRLSFFFPGRGGSGREVIEPFTHERQKFLAVDAQLVRHDDGFIDFRQ